MVNFFIFCMATVGLTAILVDGKIFLPFRERLENRVREQEDVAQNGKVRRSWSGFLYGIITCYQCCGFWSGLFCGLFFTISHWASSPLWVVGVHGDAGFAIIVQLILSPFFWLMCGFVGSFLATVYLMLVELIYAKTMLCRRTNPEPSPEDLE